MVQTIVAPEPILRTQCQLGEGPVWDARQQRLYFVDINKNRIHTYEPHSGIHGFETYDSTLSFIALRKEQPGVLVASKDAILLLTPEAGLPFPPTNSIEQQPTAPLELLTARPLPEGVLRFNDGCVDPAGRMTIGTMESDMGKLKGSLYSLDAAGSPLKIDSERKPTLKEIIPNVGCSNGTGWLTQEGSKTAEMFYTDSAQNKIFKYQYDLVTGLPSSKHVFYHQKPAPPILDGMCQDSLGGLWVCHWKGAAITRLDPRTAEITHRIEFKKCWNITCCTFGGPKLDVLYVTSAHSTESGDVSQTDMPESGDLYAIQGLGFKGVERHRYNG
ncbi:unnamed protein product [Sympodiomycopsis kandeliae]